MKEQFDLLINKAYEMHASDIHLDFIQDNYHIYFRRQNKLYLQYQLSKNEGEKLIQYIKYIANLSLSKYFKAQTGSIQFDIHDERLSLRISSIPSVNGDSLVVRIIKTHHFISIQQLSIFKSIINSLNNILTYHEGLFLISGSTGSGKTTTLYAIINDLLKVKPIKIIMIEDPIEIKQPQCLQIQLNDFIGLSFENVLKQILRHDPDVIVIGEIRDELTAKVAIRSALTGHLVLATIHARNVLNCDQRLIDLGVQISDLKATLVGICYQTLYHLKESVMTAIMEFLNYEEWLNYRMTGIINIPRISDFINYLEYEKK